jgi:hypothetical protein
MSIPFLNAPIPPKDIMWFAVGSANTAEDLDISHIEHVHAIRKMMPSPPWRTSDGGNLFPLGCGEPTMAPVDGLMDVR